MEHSTEAEMTGFACFWRLSWPTQDLLRVCGTGRTGGLEDPCCTFSFLNSVLKTCLDWPLWAVEFWCWSRASRLPKVFAHVLQDKGGVWLVERMCCWSACLLMNDRPQLLWVHKWTWVGELMCCCNAVELRKHFVHIVQGYVMTSEIGGNKSFSRVVVDWLRCKNGRGLGT